MPEPLLSRGAWIWSGPLYRASAGAGERHGGRACTARSRHQFRLGGSVTPRGIAGILAARRDGRAITFGQRSVKSYFPARPDLTLVNQSVAQKRDRTRSKGNRALAYCLRMIS